MIYLIEKNLHLFVLTIPLIYISKIRHCETTRPTPNQFLLFTHKRGGRKVYTVAFCHSGGFNRPFDIDFAYSQFSTASLVSHLVETPKTNA